MDALLLHYPPPFNPDYETEDERLGAYLAEQRMEKFADEATDLERQAHEAEENGDDALADTCRTMADNMWRSYRATRSELSDRENGLW